MNNDISFKTMTEKEFRRREIEILNDIDDKLATISDLNKFRSMYYGESEHPDHTRKISVLLRQYNRLGWVKDPELNCNEENEDNCDTQYNSDCVDAVCDNTTNNYKESVKINADGSTEKDRVITICEGQELTPELLLELHNFKPVENWTLVNVVNNFWHSQMKDGKRLLMYQSKIHARPRKSNEITLEDIDRYFKNKDWDSKIRTKQCTNYSPNGEFLEIDIADAHLGLLAWHKECGEDYNIKIAVDIVHKCIDDIIYRIGDRKLEKIYYCCLGDFLHYDSVNGKTYRDTPQDCDGRYHKMFDAALDLQIDVINRLSEITNVVVPYIAGNHDKTSSYSLIKAVEMAFRKCDNVTFDTKPISRKIIQEGNVLIGLSHGCMKKKNAENWIIADYRKELCSAVYVEQHNGHFHSLKTIEDENAGILHRYLPSVCTASEWEHWEGYPRGLKYVLSFLWNKDSGLRDVWYSNPNEL